MDMDVPLKKPITIKLAKSKLVAKPSKQDHKKRHNKNTSAQQRTLQYINTANSTQIFYLPLMPTDKNEREVYKDAEYRCFYCSELCDEFNLQCKVCSKVAHVTCLYQRGHISKLDVPLKLDWTCADCCDLTKMLSDEDIRRLINIYEQLDVRNDSFVGFADYMRIKEQTYKAREGVMMSSEQRAEEERRFRLIDVLGCGTITWSEFCFFESSNLLSKKNKIELSNYLSIKELIRAKRIFLSYDKDKTMMISRDAARSSYIEFIERLEQKLGLPFIEHIKNCIGTLGLQNNEKKVSVLWPEFLRKITILLLFDRINSDHFQPKLSTFRLSHLTREVTRESEEVTSTLGSAESRPHSSAFQMKRDPVREIVPKTPSVKNRIYRLLDLTEPPTRVPTPPYFNKDFGIEQIMAAQLDLTHYKPLNNAQFGSHEYVIRRGALNHSADEDFEPSEDEETVALRDALIGAPPDADKEYERKLLIKFLVRKSDERQRAKQREKEPLVSPLGDTSDSGIFGTLPPEHFESLQRTKSSEEAVTSTDEGISKYPNVHSVHRRRLNPIDKTPSIAPMVSKPRRKRLPHLATNSLLESLREDIPEEAFAAQQPRVSLLPPLFSHKSSAPKSSKYNSQSLNAFDYNRVSKDIFKHFEIKNVNINAKSAETTPTLPPIKLVHGTDEPPCMPLKRDRDCLLTKRLAQQNGRVSEESATARDAAEEAKRQSRMNRLIHMKYQSALLSKCRIST